MEPILWGRSFGAASALISHFIFPKLTEALIIESPFTSVPDVYRSIFPYCCIGRILACITHLSWRNDQIIHDVEVPILFVCGTNDTLTPIEMTRELYRRALLSSRKQLYEVIGGGHSPPLHTSDSNYWNKIY